MATRERIILFLLGFSFCFLIILSHQETDTILQGQSIRDWERLVSVNGIFILQFFNVRSSKYRYFGIFFSYVKAEISMRDVAWVANRDNPIPDTSGNLMMHSNGTLTLSYSNNGLIELSSVPTRSNTSATLLDNGNFVLREVDLDGSTGQILWQSFDYPTHMLISSMRIGVNFRTGHKWSLTSWLSDKLPASGPFTLGIDPNGTDQLVMWWRGDVFWTSGPWNGRAFESMCSSHPGRKFDFQFVSNENEKFFTFSTLRLNTSLLYIDLCGEVSELIPSLGRCYNVTHDEWCMKEKLPDCRIDNYLFNQAYIDYYSNSDSNEFKLVESHNISLFDVSHNTSLFDCEDRCLRICSCVAYAYINDDGTGCQIWLKGMELQSLHVSHEYSRPIYTLTSKKEIIKWWKWLAIAVGGALLIFLFCYLCYVRLRRVIKEQKETKILFELGVPTKYKDKKKSHELQVFNFETIMVATNNFSDTNKLGEGGFGPVYKGNFSDGQVIAIKRLSKSSGQGLVEFRNEILLIAKLQHNNLVRLLGCCIEGEEKMLIYEYMPNQSLNFFLFVVTCLPST